jgi:hypothetical protein
MIERFIQPRKIYTHQLLFLFNIVVSIICVSSILFTHTLPHVRAENINTTNQKVILILWDGTQRNHLLELYNNDQLPNLKSVVENGGLLRTDMVINTETCEAGSGDGYDTETGPANSAIVTGYGYPITQNQDNRFPNPIPQGLTFFERVKEEFPEIKTGMITNKSQSFWPLPALENAQPTIDYWWNNKAFNYRVASHASTFLNTYWTSPFFLYLHFRVPDETGHEYNENSSEYTNALIDNDNHLGTILTQLSNLGIADETIILITTDHGFEEGGFEHEECIDETRNTWIVSNRATAIGDYSVPAYQTSITPALFDLFGMDKNAVEPAFPSQSIHVLSELTPTPTTTLDGSPTPTATLVITTTPTATVVVTTTPTATLDVTPTPTITLESTPTPTATLEYTPTPTEQPNLPPTETPTPTGVPPFKLVFVTNATFTGNFGGLSGADQICQDAAAQAGLSGIFKAWLSDSTTSVTSRITPASDPYQRIDGVVIANNWADLLDSSLFAPISITEYGAAVVGTGVWTNTKGDGSIASTTNTCTDWSSSSGQGFRGNNSSTGRIWTNNGLMACSNDFHLYCVQQ